MIKNLLGIISKIFEKKSDPEKKTKIEDNSDLKADKTKDVKQNKIQKNRLSEKKKIKEEGERRKTTKESQFQENKKSHWKPSDFPVDPVEGKTRFHDLDLPTSLLRAVCDLNFKYCTPIQAEILPKTIAGRDATGQAQTGTGKTAAFLISIITNIIRKPIRGKRMKGTPRALILAPTRELALQIEKDAESLIRHSKIKVLCMIGGAGFEKQKKFLIRSHVDIAIATPGRLLDFVRRRLINLRKIETLVIDEADRMLDMGFIPDIRKIIRMTPPKEKRQTLFFSATLNADVLRLSSYWTKESFRAEIEPDQIASKTVDQKVYLTTLKEKFFLLYNIVTRLNLTRSLIFTNRRDQARDLAFKLCKAGIKAALISGELSQNKRTQALENFRTGKINCLVATDVAARGIHIEGISHVINYNVPQEAEHYVHRIGRTGRAGCEGVSITFADENDSFYIPPIEKVLGHDLDCEYPPEEFTKKPDLSQVVPVELETSKGGLGNKPGKRGKYRYRPKPKYGKKGTAKQNRGKSRRPPPKSARKRNDG